MVSRITRALATRVKAALDLVDRREAEEISQRAYLQMEDYLELGRRLPDLEFRGFRGYAISPDVSLHLVDVIESRCPSTVLELGSGVSTIVLGAALQRYSPGSRLVSLDHSKNYADSTKRLVVQASLDHIDVRVAELRDVPIDDGTARWYDPETLVDLDHVDMLFIDGPPSTLGKDARLPSVEVLADRMAPGAVIVIDDAHRPEEQRLAGAWARRTGGTLDHFDTENGLVAVTMPAAQGAVG